LQTLEEVPVEAPAAQAKAEEPASLDATKEAPKPEPHELVQEQPKEAPETPEEKLEVPVPSPALEEPTKLDALHQEPAQEEVPSEVPQEVPQEVPAEVPAEVPVPDAAPVPEEEVHNYFPRVEWTTQAHSPQLTGRAAEFIEYSNIVLANQDFKGLQDLFKYFDQQYALSDEATQAVRHAIMQNAEQALMESVAGVLSLKNDPSWRGHYQQALSKEALSALVMQRFWSVKAIEKDLLAQIEGASGGAEPA